jgi:hypothetical protein
MLEHEVFMASGAEGQYDNELPRDIFADENCTDYPQEDEQHKAQWTAKNAECAQCRQRAAKRVAMYQRTARDLGDEFAVVYGRQFNTPLANIAEATFLLRGLPPCPENAEALKLTRRAYVLLDEQNPIRSVHHTNSRNDQQASSKPHSNQPPHPDQSQGSQNGDGRPRGNPTGGQCQQGAPPNPPPRDLR